MPLPGGQAAKAGLIYENYIAIQEVLNILFISSDDTYIYFERPDDISGGIEFEVGNNTEIKYFQVKSSSPNWTIKRLESDKVLQNFKKKLENNNNASCIFYSNSTTNLYEISKRAQKGDFKAFQDCIKNTQDCINDYESLKNHWNLVYHPEQAFNYLQRTYCHIIDEQTLIKHINQILSSNFEGKPEDINDYLFKNILCSYGKKFSKQDLHKNLISKFKLLQLSSNLELLKNIENLNDSFINKIKSNTQENLKINREELTELFNTFSENEKTKIIFITGEAGIGKSFIMFDIYEHYKNLEWKLLSCSIDNYPSISSLYDIGKKLYNYEKSPDEVISNIACSNHALIIIDQLDALSIVSGRHSENWAHIQNLFEQGCKKENLKFIVACRQFDLDNDERINSFIRNNEKHIKIIQLKHLSDDAVCNALNNMGFDILSITEKQKTLFSNPLNLKLLAQVKSDSNILNYQTRVDLYNKFWDKKKQDIKLKKPDCHYQPLSATL